MADTQILSGGPASAAQAMVSADQVTVFGNGTRWDPLRLAGGVATSYLRSYAGAVAALVGRPVVFSEVDASTVRPTNADFSFHVVGVIAALRTDDKVVFQSDGWVTLSTEAWDAVTGESGGLHFGPYYVSTTIGQLTRVAPTVSNTHRIQVGIALSPTTLILTTPSQSIANP